MKKLFTILISLLMVFGLVACASKGSVVGVDEGDGRYVVTFENATKDMGVATEMTLEENHAFTFSHELNADDDVLIEYKNEAGEVAMDNEVKDFGGGQVYITPGKYMVEITVLGKANGTVTIYSSEIENEDVENPWKTTEDMQEAIDATGVTFNSPIEEALPGGIKYYMSFYSEDIFQANYGSEDNSNGMFIRVSKNHEGKEDLAGDYNEYEKTWHESVKGLDVTCYGEEDSIHLATFSSGDQNYSINYNVYQDGPGMTVNELNSLLMGM